MSEVKSTESVYVAALFPKEGRLPSDPQKVSDNYDPGSGRKALGNGVFRTELDSY